MTASCTPLRVLLDCNGVDPLIDIEGAFGALHEAVESGAAEVMFTDGTLDELVATPDLDRRRKLTFTVVALGKLVPSGGFILGKARLGFARLLDGDTFDRLSSGGARHGLDATIAAAAMIERGVLVTNERRLTNRARQEGIEVWTTVELLRHVGFEPK